VDGIEITPIEIPFPSASYLDLKLALGACRLNVAPGGNQPWVSGSYRHPTGTLPLLIEEKDGSVKLSQEYRKLRGIGQMADFVPVFDLALGKERPYRLSLEGGASESRFDLGGLPLRRLVVRQGAGKVDIDFSAQNPEVMDLLDLEAGAVGLAMANLANANCTEMVITGGAASYKLGFGGTLRRDLNVSVTAGMASVEIEVPAPTAVKVLSEGSVGASLKVGDGFTTREGALWNPAAMAGSTPALTIRAKITLGSLQLRTI